jgi:hypothetical protein
VPARTEPCAYPPRLPLSHGYRRASLGTDAESSYRFAMTSFMLNP